MSDLASSATSEAATAVTEQLAAEQLAAAPLQLAAEQLAPEQLARLAKYRDFLLAKIAHPLTTQRQLRWYKQELLHVENMRPVNVTDDLATRAQAECRKSLY
jgi:hypothetical protein